MKVLEKGSGQKGWSVKTTCTGNGNGDGGCGAKLLVEQPDLFFTSRSDHGGGHETYTTFECVECGVLTDLPSNASPPRGIYGLPSRGLWLEKKCGTV